MSVLETRTAGSSSNLLFAPADGKAYSSKDHDHVFSQQPLEHRRLPRYLVPSPTSRMKPPELKYGWRIGREKFMDLIHTQFPDGITCTLGPEIDEDDSELDIPPEEFQRPYPDTHATLFGMALVDSILRYLDVPVTDTNRRSLEVDYLCDSQARPEVGLILGSTYTGKVLVEPHYSKLKALVSPNEDAKWYLGFDNWQWRRQIPKETSKSKGKKSTATAPAGTTTVS
ncbi:hypothetical protein LXA43DRAFT_1098234 [Ganoderma leucocontextum]|nr:hypothetical protein LXA43DRAFT_1098234 [Ganoderma leucocontextum]